MVHVSTITMHDMLYTASVAALRVNDMSEKIARDLLVAEQWLSRDYVETLEARFAWLAGILSAAVAYLAVSNVGDRVIRIFAHPPPSPADSSWPTLLVAAIALFVAALTFKATTSAKGVLNEPRFSDRASTANLDWKGMADTVELE
jgi:hypothetical protein